MDEVEIPGTGERLRVGFNPGARVPTGVTPVGILEERRRIEETYGEATVDATFAALTENRKAYPNIAAFCPRTKQEAWERATREGIRRAYQSVVTYYLPKSSTDPKAAKPVRLLHIVVEASGERAYELLPVIARDKGKTLQVFEALRKAAESYSARLSLTMDEIAALLEGDSVAPTFLGDDPGSQG